MSWEGAVAISPQQVEQWILQSNEPGQHQRQAVHLLQQWTLSAAQQHCDYSNNNAVSAVLFQLLQQTGYPVVQFYALSTLHRLSLSAQQRSQLRTYLLHYQLPSSRGSHQQQLPTFLRNKAASLLAAHLIQDTATAAWPTVDLDLLQLAASHPALFLQTVIAVLDDFSVVSSHAAANDDISAPRNHSDYSSTTTTTTSNINNVSTTSVSAAASTTLTVDQTRRFKDVLKGYHNQTAAAENTPTGADTAAVVAVPTLLQRLFGAATHIFEVALSQDPSEELQLLALQAVTGFFQWTTDSFLGDAVPRCMELLLYTVQSAGGGVSTAVCKASLHAWQELATSCSSTTGNDSVNNNNNGTTTTAAASAVLASSIQSVADPKLPVLCKLLERIHETNMLPAANNNNNTKLDESSSSPADSVDAETMEVIIQMAVVINSVSLELLPLYEQQVLSQQKDSRNRSVEALFHQVLDLFFRAFCYDDIDVATAVLPFATRLTFFMEEDDSNNKGAKTSGSMRQHLPLVLNTLYNQMKYPVDFRYDYEDEDDGEEEVFRTELCKVFGKLVRAAPATCLQFVCEAASAQLSTNNVAAAPTPDIEATLRLLYHYCEAIRPPPGLKVVMRNDTFCALLKAFHNSNIAQHPHQEVVCLYYETAVRYYPIFLQKEHTELLATLLGAMSGTAGLQHEHPRVRSRCCYLLLRLVKATVSLLRPFTETAVAGIQALLSNPNLELRPDDTLFLFETIGLLLGKTGLESADQQRYLTAVMTPHVQSIEQILANVPGLQRDAEHYGEVLSGSIAAITHLSKGFAKPADEVSVVLVQALNITLTVLQVLPTSDHVRNKSMVLLQRMILCVGKNVLPMMPQFLQLLVDYCTSDDILFVSQVFNQLCIKFKDEAVPVMDAALVPFLQKCQSLVPVQDDVADAPDNLPPHLRTEQLSVQKLAFAVLQHIVSCKATAVLVSPTNSGHFESVLKTMSDGAIHVNDPVVKKTCIRFFRELIEQWARPNGVDDGYRRGFLAFVSQSFIPGVFQSMLSQSFNARDSNQARVVSEFSNVLFSVKSGSDTDELYQQCVGHMLALRPFPPGALDAFRLASNSEGVEACLFQILRVSTS